MRSEGNASLKNPVTPPGIDPGTVRLVAQRLNHYATPGPMRDVYILISLRMEPINLSESLAHTYKTAMQNNPENNIKFEVVSIPSRGTCSLTGVTELQVDLSPLTRLEVQSQTSGLESGFWERPRSILGRFVFLIPSTQMP